MKRPRRIATVLQGDLFNQYPKLVYLHKRRGRVLTTLAKSARGTGAGEDPGVVRQPLGPCGSLCSGSLYKPMCRTCPYLNYEVFHHNQDVDLQFKSSRV